MYLIGHHFKLYTDHKPLLALLNSQRSTSPQASARIRRWSLLLSSYEYGMEFRDTLSHGNADALSRLPLPVCPPEGEQLPEIILLMDHLSDSPVTAQQIQAALSCSRSSTLSYSRFCQGKQSCQFKMDVSCGEPG